MKDKIKDVSSEYICIAIGAVVMAMGMNLFLVPCKLSSGGVGAIGTILLYLFNIPLSVTNLAFNAVLFAFGYKYLGKGSVVKTVAGIVFLSAALELTNRLPRFDDDMFIATVIGGALVGIGVGFVVRVEASTGGSDFAALIIKKFLPYISVASLILIIDSIIVIVFGLVFKSYTIVFYSAIAMFISSKVTDAVVNFGNDAKSVYVISKKSDEIAKTVMEKFERGVTGVYSKGLYTDEDGMMLLCVVAPRELPRLIHTVRKIDKNAFAITSDAREVFGEGFKEKTEYDKIFE